MIINPDTSITVAEAKEWLRANWNKKAPAQCPCCTRKVQLRTYEMTGETIDMLRELWQTFGPLTPFHLPTEVTRISQMLHGKPGRPGDLSMVRHWDLIMKVGKNVAVSVGSQEVAGTQVADYVLLPELGAFLEGDHKVPAWIQMFNNQLIDRSDILVGVQHFMAIGVEVEDVEVAEDE